MNNTIIDKEGYRLECYFIEDCLQNYKKILSDINSDENEYEDLFTKLLVRENFNLKQQFESLTHSIKVNSANVFNEYLHRRMIYELNWKI